MKKGLDCSSLNITELEENDTDFAMSTFIDLIPSAASTRMDNTISLELEETIISAPPLAATFTSLNDNQTDPSMRGHLDQLAVHAINKIAGRMRRHDLTNGTDATINDWSFLEVDSDTDTDEDTSDESTILADKTHIITPSIPHIKFVNGTPTTVGYKDRIMYVNISFYPCWFVGAFLCHGSKYPGR